MASERLPIGSASQIPMEGFGDESDAALAERGDAEDFMLLYRRYVRPVYRYMYARLGNRQDAEDLTAIVWERAWISLKCYRATGSFKGWLFTIAHRALVDHYRAHKSNVVPVDDMAEILADPAADPEAHALEEEQVRQVRRAVAGLSQEQQDVISLRFAADLRYSEIARITGKREAAVKMMAYRALDEIRRRFDDVRL